MIDAEYEAMLQRIACAPGSARDIEKAQAAQWWSSVTKTKRSAFDFEGVSEHLKGADQLEAFFEQVTGSTIAPNLPVNRQAALARRLVAMGMLTRWDRDVSARFIRENAAAMVMNPHKSMPTKEEEQKLLRADLIARYKRYQDDFCRGIRGMTGALIRMREIQKDWPLETPRPVTSEFREALRTGTEIINALDARDLT